MFWQNPRTPEFDDLTKIEVNSFRGFEKQLIEYVKDKKCLDISKLPTEDEIREIYSQDSLIPCVNSILKGYRKKIDMLADL